MHTLVAHLVVNMLLYGNQDITNKNLISFDKTQLEYQQRKIKVILPAPQLHHDFPIKVKKKSTNQYYYWKTSVIAAELFKVL